MKNYELTNETIQINGVTLYRIKRLSDDLLGGYIESEANLSQYGTCFVYDKARVFGKAQVSGKARVYGEALVFGKAQVFGDAQVYGEAHVFGKALVSGKAKFQRTIQALYLYPIVLGPDWLCIGCESHSLGYWKKNIDCIGERNGYTKSQIKTTKILLNQLLKDIKDVR